MIERTWLILWRVEGKVGKESVEGRGCLWWEVSERTSEGVYI
jgi:hypothetical protein